MTKKHFEMIARILKVENDNAKGVREKEIIERIASSFVVELQKTNTRFDIRKFLCFIFG